MLINSTISVVRLMESERSRSNTRAKYAAHLDGSTSFMVGVVYM